MAIPKEILEIERPKSTRVKYFNGTYFVVKRTSVYRNGKAYPVELGTIGKIEDGKYIEIRKEPRKQKATEVDVKEYGATALGYSVSSKLLDELKETFDVADANKLYVMALLRAVNEHITSRTMKIEYDTSYLSEIIPNVAVSESTICEFLKMIGKGYRRIERFMINRVEKANGNIVIDGMLKNSNGHNSFNEFSRKAKVKGSKDISLLYAYDFEEKEPLASRIYPGNMLDVTAFKDFVASYGFKNSILIMDKGFYSEENLSILKQQEGVSFVVPIKQNTKKFKAIIDANCIAQPLSFKDQKLLCGKYKLDDGTFLYAYQDLEIEAQQKENYYEMKIKTDSFNAEEFRDKAKTFGVIVFESKSDLEPYAIYEAYSFRWEIEAMFNLYKNILNLNSVNAHNDYSIIATEFINFLSTIIGSRIKRKIKSVDSTKHYSTKEVFSILSKYKVVKNTFGGDWTKLSQIKKLTSLFSDLGI